MAAVTGGAEGGVVALSSGGWAPGVVMRVGIVEGLPCGDLIGRSCGILKDGTNVE